MAQKPDGPPEALDDIDLEKSAARITFNITNCRDMLLKLVWELECLKDPSTSRAQKCYHAVNSAWTAWHLHEWVWAGLKHRHDLKVRYAREANCLPNEFGPKKFGKSLARSNPDIGLCQRLATSAKHLGFESRQQIFTTVVSAGVGNAATLDEVTDFDELTNFDSLEYPIWSLKLVVDDRRIPAVELFERVVGFWTQMIYGEDIDA